MGPLFAAGRYHPAMVEFIRRRDLRTRIAIAVLVIAAVPFVLPVTFETKELTNGELTSYSYLNLTALIGGFIAIGYAVRAFSAARAGGELTATVGVLLALVVLLGAFQLVRGSGMVPHLTECTAEHSLDLCRPATGD